MRFENILNIFVILVLLAFIVVTIITYIKDKKQRKIRQALHDAMILENERHRIAHDLHDGTIQSLYSISLKLGKIAQEIDHKKEEEISQDILMASENLAAAISDIRGYIYEETPKKDLQVTLQSALHKLVNELHSSTGHTIDFDYVNSEDAEISKDIIKNVCLIVKEAVVNTIKHAHATKSLVIINVNSTYINLIISDDGEGFVKHNIHSKGYGIGTHSIATRVAKLNGVFTVTQDKGVTIKIKIPLGVEHSVKISIVS